MHLSCEEKETIITILKSSIPSLQAIYLFGSFYDNSANDESDIDIAFLATELIDIKIVWKISQKLSILLQRDVDLVELRTANTIFRYEIISNSDRIYGNGYDVEYFETVVYSFYLRFQQERKPIVDAIYADKKVFHVN